MALITVENCWKGFNDRQLLQGVTLRIREGERIGLVGQNGSGKSTLLRILAGVETAESGTVTKRRGLSLGYLEQDPELDPQKTIRATVREGLAAREGILAQLERLHEELAFAPEARLAGLLARQGRLEEALEHSGGHDVEHRVESTLHALGLSDFEAPCGPLSGGERRRVALARLLLGGPELLLLDEPTNHLDAFVTDWLEDWFLETRTPLLLVTHDRYFLDRVVDRIVELDRGQLVVYDGGYAEYVEARAARLASESKAESARLNLLRRETAWMRRGPPARSTKAKARIHRYDDLVDAAPTELAAQLEFSIPPGPRLGTRVLKLAGVSKRYGDRVVVPPLDLELGAGTRLGIVGPNGAGKTTLVRLLLGEIEPDSGVREVGETVRFMGIDQMRTDLDPSHTVAEEVAGSSDVIRTDERVVRVEGFLDKFGFKGPARQARISQLSGGERNRVLLAKLLCAGGNALVLDEPTNDLDLATLRALEEALIAFPGVVAIVSHDRWFLDRVATQILYMDGQGGTRLHHGDMSSLLKQIADQARAAQAAPRKAPKQEAPRKPGRAKRIAPWEQRELDELEGRIPTIESEIEAIDGELADPALYSGSGDAVAEIQSRRAALEAELAERYARWEELETLRG